MCSSGTKTIALVNSKLTRVQHVTDEHSPSSVVHCIGYTTSAVTRTHLSVNSCRIFQHQDAMAAVFSFVFAATVWN